MLHHFIMVGKINPYIPGFHPWVGKVPWRRTWQPTPVFLPREFHGQRSLAGYSPWGRKEMEMTELLALSNTGNIGKGILHKNC